MSVHLHSVATHTYSAASHKGGPVVAGIGVEAVTAALTHLTALKVASLVVMLVVVHKGAAR